MNYSDSERISGFLEEFGFQLVSAPKEADLVVFNTCGVRQMAEDRVYGQVYNLATKTAKRPIIILTGCLAHRKDVQRRLKDKVDLFVSIKDFKKEIKKTLNTKYQIQNTFDRIRPDEYFSIKPKYASKHTAYVPIMTGCNNFCSYCVVPYARGREISRPAEEIIAEVKSLIKKGYKEIILLGQNVNSYQSFDKNSSSEEEDKLINFSILLKKINSIPGNFWINFVSNHPKDFSDELIETATKLPKVCETIHLPIQAGDDKILAKMNRKYTAKQYLKKVEKIKKAFGKNKPGKLFAITSDIIVGFPSETKKQFLESGKIMEKVGFDMVFFGQFSRRPETTAWKMKDNVSKVEKARREKYLNEILKKTSLKNNKNYVGRTLEVLVQKEKDGSYFGKTRTGKNVKIISQKKNLVGKIVKVKITKANIWNLEACFPKRQGETK
jgi:tRNA-2-methylthio-N6-dimethylallyladenosine synthase